MRLRSIALMGGSLMVTGCSLGANLPASEAAIGRFHTEFNAAQFDGIYDAATDAFKAAAPKPMFEKFMNAVERKLGKFKTGKNEGWKEYTGTGGHTVSVTFQAEFEKGPATESFVYSVADGKVALQAYNVNSPLLVLN
jgi:hypothetical protein